MPSATVRRPGAADLVDAPGRALHRDAGGDRGLARGVLALRGGEHLAHDHLGDVVALDAGALQRGLDGDRRRVRAPVWLPNAPLKLPTGVRAALTMTISSLAAIVTFSSFGGAIFGRPECPVRDLPFTG
jgi:hypothetical protein